MAKCNSLEKYTISSKPVLVSYIHAGVFVPVLNKPVRGQEHFTFAPATNTSIKLAYWDQDAYVKELIVSDGNNENSGQAPPPATTDKGDSNKLGKDGEKKTKKRKAEAALGEGVKKPLASHLEFWTNRHKELHGKSSTPSADADSTQATLSSRTGSSTKEKDDRNPPSQSFADPIKNCCYLCSRQFKSAAEVNKHERVSDLHQTNLKNDDLVRKALAKLGNAGLPVNRVHTTDTAEQAEDTTTEEYRDRAKERRTLFNQPKQPGFKGQGTGRKADPNKAANVDATTAPSSSHQAAAPPSDATVAPGPMGKGASLLGKMGWSAGQGLGASGGPATAPIATDLYVAGVGLGAVGGKLGDAVEEAGRATRGDYGEFAQRAKDKARERYESLA